MSAEDKPLPPKNYVCYLLGECYANIIFRGLNMSEIQAYIFLQDGWCYFREVEVMRHLEEAAPGDDNNDDNDDDEFLGDPIGTEIKESEETDEYNSTIIRFVMHVYNNLW